MASSWRCSATSPRSLANRSSSISSSSSSSMVSSISPLMRWNRAFASLLMAAPGLRRTTRQGHRNELRRCDSLLEHDLLRKPVPTFRDHALRWRHAKRLGGGEKPRPRPLRQRNAVALAFLQDALAALTRKEDALDVLIVRQRLDVAPQLVGFGKDAVAIAERGEVDGD